MPDSSDPMDCSLPGSSVHGIFQARGLEWGAIAFSDSVLRSAYKGEKVEARNHLVFPGGANGKELA